jgi:hypothetical protein
MKDFPVSEAIARMKAEREKLYDALLQKILALPKVQEYISELRQDEECKKEGWGEFQFEESALDNFFEGDLEPILSISEIWEAVREAVRSEVEWRTSDPKTFIEELGKIDAEKIMLNKLEDIDKELYQALKRRHKKNEEATQK